MKRYVAPLLLVFVTLTFYGQTNLVPNPSFEELDKKPKESGLIELAIPWESPTKEKGDIYAKKGKEPATAPENPYGKEKAFDGDNYAGIRFYADRGRMPRSYLQVKLKETLEKGKKYCVKFHVSLADMAKYGSNNLGVYVSEKGLKADNKDILKADPQIMHSSNRIFEKQFYWEPICSVYESKGNEEYITIGNFVPTEETKTTKLRRPRGFYGSQERDSYFYIDMVSVTPMSELENCRCEKKSELDRAEVVKKSFKSDDKEKHTVKVIDGVRMEEGEDVAKGNEGKTAAVKSKSVHVYFDDKRFAITDAGKGKIDEMVKWLKENEKMKVDITGYMDKSESIPPLPAKRAETVSKYMQSQGISAARLDVKGEKTAPKEAADKTGKAGNRRVTISSKPAGK